MTNQKENLKLKVGVGDLQCAINEKNPMDFMKSLFCVIGDFIRIFDETATDKTFISKEEENLINESIERIEKHLSAINVHIPKNMGVFKAVRELVCNIVSDYSHDRVLSISREDAKEVLGCELDVKYDFDTDRIRIVIDIDADARECIERLLLKKNNLD